MRELETRRQRNKRRKRRNRRIFTFVFIVMVSFIVIIGVKNKDSILNIKNNLFKKEESESKSDKKEQSIINYDDAAVQEADDNFDYVGTTTKDEFGNNIYSYGRYKIKESNGEADSIKFWFNRNNDFNIPESPLLDKQMEDYDVRYVGKNDKVIYLTFNETEEKSQTSRILDILRDNNIKASFFMTNKFMEANKEIVKRIVNEGHICGNLTYDYVNMSKLAANNPIEFIKEIVDNEESFKKITNKDMSKYIRLPDGIYSDRTFEYMHQIGYKTVFWSFAYKDWNANWNTRDEALDWMNKYYHNGAIYLLHGENIANADALDEFIKTMQEKGYTFETIDNFK